MDSPLYKMNHPRRGEVIIFNHEKYTSPRISPRDGTQFDEDSLIRTLKTLNFNVTVYKDLTKDEINTTIKAAAVKDYTDCDCFMIVVLTHGSDNNKVYAKDQAYSVDYLWKSFTGDKVPSLAGKPKLFFLQACRGHQRDGGSYATSDTDYNYLQVYTIPTMADVLVMYATVEDFVAHRSRSEGTVFIQAICNELNENANKRHLEDMLVNVKRKVALKVFPNGKKQMPQLNSTLTRYVFFGDQLHLFQLFEHQL